MSTQEYQKNKWEAAPEAEQIQNWLIQHIAEQLTLEPQDIDIQEPFVSYGLSSRDAVTLSGDLELWLGLELSPTLAWEYPTIRALTDHLIQQSTYEGKNEQPGKTDRQLVTQTANEEIAIIGLGCRFPGAENPDQFWKLLREGREGITDVPTERGWAVQYEENTGKTNTAINRGGFLQQIDQFDAEFFGISPREATWMDPQQRLLLEVAWETLEDTGIAPETLAGSRTGVFIGISTNDYARSPLASDNINAYLGTGNAFSIAANRLSYLLDLRGPSIAIDTACSSSLVAIHLACRSLHTHESQLALVGGVNLLVSPELSNAFSQAQMLASDGRCKTFDAAADGYGRGEGCGIVLLKRLSDAQRDGDKVLAIIRGTAVNQDGKSNGLTAPNRLAQEAVIREALQNAGIEPADLSYVESHGTGTPLGDPIELQALNTVLSEGRAVQNPCLVGSVKTNIGHLEAAAGIAGLIKTVLSLVHQEIPPHLHLHTLNPHIQQEKLSLRIPTERYTWPRTEKVRLAGISAFGFGGTNAHIILAEPPLSPIEQHEMNERSLQLLCLTARNEKALKQLAEHYIQHIEHHPEQRLEDVCYTANTGRTHFPQRLAVLTRSSKSLQEQLHAFTSQQKGAGLWSGKVNSRKHPKVAFLFTGQGSHYPGMGHQLYEAQPTFRSAVDKCAEIVNPLLQYPLQAAFTAEQSPLEDIAYTQVALFTVEYALATLWQSWGIKPNIVLGHSAGEYAAACIAGVFTLQDALKLLFERGTLLQGLQEKGAMATVLADPTKIKAALVSIPDQVCFSAFNGPKHTVLSGPTDVLPQVLAELEKQHITTHPLAVAQAYHSPFVAPIVESFGEFARQIQYASPLLPFVSTVTGALLKYDEGLDAPYWQNHLREPVHFAQGIATLAEQGVQICLELGPTPSLISMGKRCLPQGTLHWLPSLRQKQNDWHVILSTLAELYVQGVPVDWNGFDQEYQRSRVSLPTYPFERKRYWRPQTQANAASGLHEKPEPRSQFEQTTSLQIDMLDGKSEHMNEERASASQELVLTARAQKNVAIREQVLSTLREIVGRLLQLEAANIDIYAPFLEMGADSLILIEAVRTIEKTFAVKISIKQLFEELTTLDTLTTFIMSNSPTIEKNTNTPLQQSNYALKETSTRNIDGKEQQKPDKSTLNTQVPIGDNLQELSKAQVANQNNEHFVNSTLPLASIEVENIMSQQLALLSQIMSQQLSVLQSNYALSGRSLAATSVPAAQELLRQPELMRTPFASLPTNGHTGTVQGAKASVLKTSENSEPFSTTPSQIQGPQQAAPYVPYQAIKPGIMGGLTAQQKRHIDTLIKHYTQRTRRSKELTQATRAVLADNRNTAGFRFSIKEMLYPIIAKRSQGSKFWDVDGNEYVDVSMGFGVNLFGHNAPFIQKALEKQLEQGMQLGPQAELAGEVATLIGELTGMERVAFCNSGTEAVMTALRLARTATRRKRIVIFAGSYHGTFDGVLAEKHVYQNNMLVEPMAPGTPEGMIEDVLVLDYGTRQALESIQAHGQELAAVLIEPVQSRRPDLQPKEFLQQVRALTEQTGTALIFDEVITGFRIHPGGAQAWFGVRADLATYGKIVGGGMPIGVVAGKASYLDGIDGGAWRYGDSSYPQAETTFFAGTFCKHPLTMAATHAVLNELKMAGPELQERLNQRTAQLAQTLNKYFTEENVPLSIIHFGSLFRFAFSGNMDLLFYHLLNKGVYIWEGRNCFLSTAHTDADIVYIIRAIKESIGELRTGGFLPEGPGTGPGKGHSITTSAELEAAGTTHLPAIPDQSMQHSDEERTIHLTEAQKQLWLLSQVEEDATHAYTETIAVVLQGTLQIKALRSAIQTVVDRHEALRTTIAAEGELQHIASSLTIDVPLLDYSGVPADEADDAVGQWLQAENQRDFDLLLGPLVRFAILKQTEQYYLLAFSAHHIVVDGWSIGVILQEISTFYTANCLQTQPDVEKPLQFSEYIRWQQQSEKLSENELSWLAEFQDPLPILDLPLDRPRPATQSFHGARLSTHLDTSLSQALKLVSKQHSCTLFMTLLAGYTTLLHRVTGQDDILVGIPVSGRMLEGAEHLVGYCVNLVPLRSKIEDSPLFKNYLLRLKKTWLASYARHDYPFSKLVNMLHSTRDKSRFPLINATFNLDRAVDAPPMYDLKAQITLPPINYTKFDLSVNVIEQQGELLLQFDYNSDLFDEATIVRLQGYFHTLLEAICSNVEQPIKHLQILPKEELHKQFHEWNSTWQLYPLDKSVHQLFEIQAGRTPDAIALVSPAERVSYQQLNERANRVAHYLKTQNIGAEKCVGVLCERSIELITALLGILKIGGAYLPLDPAYPQERISFMLKDANVPILLTQKRLAHLTVQLQLPTLYLDGEQAVLEQQANHNLNTTVIEEQLAYVIYTSGSTGQPKGVQISQRSLLNLIYWHQQTFHITAQDHATLVASPAFDASVWEIWPYLTIGAKLSIPNEEIRVAAPDLRDWLLAQRITICFLPTPLAEAIMAQSWPEHTSLRTVLTGGDVLHQIPPELPFSVINNYGPTEQTVVTTSAPVKSEENILPPIGAPIANTQVYVLDTQMQPVALGARGELYISGDGLSRGYLQRPALTAERFVPHPYSSQPGARLYRTGDLVRYSANGLLEFLGRIDQQIKLRGFRIELNEIEAILCQQERVREALVILHEDQTGEKRLIAYVVIHGEAPPESVVSSLRAHLRELLPDYMIPTDIIQLDELPLTPNGKIDRQALPKPERQQALQNYFAPATPIEQQLATIWEELLNLNNVGLHDSFFELGGHSLLLTQLATRIRASFHLDLPLRTLFHVPILEEMAHTIDEAMREQLDLTLEDAIPSLPRENPLPLSFAQQRIWFLQQLDQQSLAYTIPLVVRLQGRLEPEAMQQTLYKIVARHEILHTLIRSNTGEPYQQIVEPERFTCQIVDLRAIPSPFHDDELHKYILQETQRPFDLENDLPIRACLLQMSHQEHLLILLLHHIAADGWSAGILVQEIASYYTGLTTGEVHHESLLPALPIQYRDFAAWQRTWLQGERLQTLLAYWQRQLANAAPLLDLPTDRPRTQVQTFNGATLSFVLTKELSAALIQQARHYQVTLFMLLLAAFQILLHSYSRQKDILIGTPIANRTRQETEKLIGMFVNTLVLRTQIDGKLRFSDLLNNVRDMTLEAYTHQDLPFELLVDTLAPERSLSHHPLFQVFFALQNAPLSALELPGLVMQPLKIDQNVAKFDLTLTMEESKEGLRGELEYNTDLFEASTMTRMLGHFQTILEDITIHAEQEIWRFCPLTAPEKHQLLVAWNETQADYPTEQSIQQLVDAQVTNTPLAPAVTFGQETLTYQELNERANRVAHALLSLGVGPEVLVGLCVERSLDMLIGLLAILKAGGAYLPLDPAFPAERIAYMLQDAQVPVLLTQQHLVSQLLAHQAYILCLDDDGGLLAQQRDDSPHTTVSPENLAYVIYTSGSTGRPKGVQISQNAAVNLLYSMQRELELLPQDRFVAVTTLSFDIATLEMLLPLITGAHLIIAERDTIINGEALARLLEKSKSTILQATPITWRILLASGWQIPANFKILCGGEALPTDLAEQLTAEGSGVLYNLYGPTETTIWSTVEKITAVQEITIGRPIANTCIYILDNYLQPVPIGVSGELYIGGIGLSRGYLHRPELTAEKFIPHPFSTQPGERLYRTGDLAYYRADGRIFCLGRADFQIKLRGFRIELGEIESVLRQQSVLQEAVVILREDRAGDQQLVAYIVPKTEVQHDMVALTQMIHASFHEKLPDYMVPSEIVVLHELPRTPNNKIDRKALPIPEQRILEQNTKILRTPVEQQLATLWADLLGKEHVTPEDNFFALGGHSLLLTQLATRIRTTFHLDLSLQVLFQEATLERMAAAITHEMRAHSALSKQLPLVHVSREQDLPLSFAQQRLWFLQQLDPQNPAYNMPSPVRLQGQLAVDLLEQTLQEIVQRHESLRTIFPVKDGSAIQLITRPDISLRTVDLSKLAPDKKELQLQEIILQESQKPFKLAEELPIRCSLLILDEHDYVLLLTFHHIVSDGWSTGILIRELGAIYNAFAQGSPSPLPEQPIQYADFAVWQRNLLQGDYQETLLSYWKKQLAGAPSLLALPTDRPRPSVQSYQGASLPFAFTPKLSTSLKTLAQSEQVTLFMLLLASFQLLLQRYSQQDDIVIGTPIANRTQAETENLIGVFINTLVLRTRILPRQSFKELLAHVRQNTLEAYVHQDLPFEMLINAMAPERNLSYHPLFQVMFVLQNTPTPELEMSDLQLTPLAQDSKIARFDLTLNIEEGSENLHGSLEYSTDLFDENTMLRLLANYQTLLEQIVHHPEQEVWRLSALTPVEQQQVLLDWNETDHAVDESLTLADIFETQAERAPEAIALVYENQQVSYREVNERANQLAYMLQEAGIGAESCVGLAIERSIEMVVSILAILKAGGAYVPLDPAYPNERLSFMLIDAQISFLLTQQHLQYLLPEVTIPTLYLDQERARIALQPVTNPKRSIVTDNLAYVIYTSGSTGKPKGTLVSHRGLYNLAEVQSKTFEITAQSKVLQFASMNFDASISELAMTFIAGATLCLASREILLAGPALLDLLRAEEITKVTLPPSILAVLPENDIPTLRTIVSAGEACTAELVARWAPGRRFFNAYGPTELTVCSSITECFPDGAPPTIGRPIANTQAYVLDPFMQPLPIGAIGELYLGGIGIARGYLDQPALTAERFLPHPFSKNDGERIYKTGDLARWHDDGALEYLGRSDQQVKLHGFRIELGEIEEVLSQHPAVQDVIVMVREDQPGHKRLVAYITTAQEKAPTVSELKQFLQERVPHYLIPAQIMQLAALPFLPNGKVDRKALPAPTGERSEQNGSYVAPRTEIETALAEICASVLGVERIGINDNFFELGGDSILSIQIIIKAKEAGIQLSPKQFFQYQTIAQLADVADIAPVIQAEQGSVIGEAPLTPIQHWFFELENPEKHHWNQTVLLIVKQPLETDLLRTASKYLLQQHDTLRARYIQEGQNWRQTFTEFDETEDVFRYVDLTDENEPVQALESVAIETQRSLNLQTGPLIRIVYFKLNNQQARLLLTVHHLAVDIVSWYPLLEDLQTVYQCLQQKIPVHLPLKTSSYKAWATQLSAYAQTSQLRQELDYWLAPHRESVSPIPLDYPAGDSSEATVQSLVERLENSETTALLRDVPNVYHMQVNEVLLTALALCVSSWVQTTNVLINLEGYGREELFEAIDISRTVGWFTTIYPVLLEVSKSMHEEPGVALKSIKEQLRRVPQRGIGYGLLRYLTSNSEYSERLRALPKAAIAFNYQGQLGQSVTGLFELATEPTGQDHSPKAQRGHQLEINAYIVHDQLHIDWIYSEQQYKRTTIEGLAQEFIRALRTLIAHCQSSEAGGYTPSDFTKMNFEQDELDQLMNELSLSIEE